MSIGCLNSKFFLFHSGLASICFCTKSIVIPTVGNAFLLPGFRVDSSAWNTIHGIIYISGCSIQLVCHLLRDCPVFRKIKRRNRGLLPVSDREVARVTFTCVSLVRTCQVTSKSLAVNVVINWVWPRVLGN